MEATYTNSSASIFNLTNYNQTLSTASIPLTTASAAAKPARPSVHPTFVLSLYIIMGCVAVVGIIGNVCVCFIITRGKKMYTVANLYLMNLAIADILVLAICYPLTIIRDETSWPFGAVLCKALPAVSDCFYGVSMGCITAIAIYRYRMILHPMSPQMTFFHAKIIMVIVWIIALCIISVPLCWVLTLESKRIYVNNVVTNATNGKLSAPFTDVMGTNSSIPLMTTVVPRLTPNSTNDQALPVNRQQASKVFYICRSKWPSERFRKIYQIVQVTWYILPLSVILFTYLRIRTYLKKTLKYDWVASSGNSAMKQSGLTGRVLSIKRALTLLAPVVVTFAVLMFPWNLMRFLSIVMETFWQIPNLLTYLKIAGAMMITNSCSNPFIYYIVSKEFRDEFRKQFRAITRCYKLSRDDASFFVSRSQSCRSQTRVETMSAVDDNRDGDINGFNNSWEKYAARVPESPLIRATTKRDNSKRSVRFPNDLPDNEESENLITPAPDPDRETIL